MKTLKALAAAAAGLLLTSCGTGIISSLSLNDRIKGAWRIADGYGHCYLNIGDSTLCFVDDDPENEYKYTLRGDTLCVPNLAFALAVAAVHGDTLVLSSGQRVGYSMALLPFESVNIHGLNRPIPHGSDSVSKEKFSEMLMLLSMERVDNGNIRKWNDVLVYAGPEAARTADRYAAKRYKKHPKRFLKWVYSQRDLDSNKISAGVFGGWERSVGFPDRQHVAKRIPKLKDPQCREYLTKLLDKGFAGGE